MKKYSTEDEGGGLDGTTNGIFKKGGYAYHLNKALYGLKHVPRERFSTFTEYIINKCYRQVNEDQWAYIHENGVTLTIYMDDLPLIGPCG